MGIFDKLFKKPQPTTSPKQSAQLPVQKKEPDPMQNIVDSLLNREKTEPEHEKKPEINIPQIYEGKQLTYHYPDVKLIPPGGPLNGIIFNTKLTIKDDTESIKVYQDKLFIGTMPNNRLSEMIRDWNKTGDPYLAYVVSYEEDGSDIQIFLAFYSDIIGKFLKKNRDAKLIKLIGKQDEFAYPYIGAECEVEYDDDKEKYFVSLDGSSLGWLPVSASKYASDHEIDPNELEVIVAEVDYDLEKDRDVISVYISD